MNRNLDFVYFRVCRDGEWQNICFTDLTDDERINVTRGRDAKWWESLALHLAECLRNIGNTFNIMGKADDFDSWAERKEE